jgi:hypothetical protein
MRASTLQRQVYWFLIGPGWRCRPDRVMVNGAAPFRYLLPDKAALGISPFS